MKHGFLAAKGTLDKKPPHGAPCNRCGLCCVATLCPLARHVFGREVGPCPALLDFETGASRCGLVEEPMKHAIAVTLRSGVEATSAAARHLIGSGTGCDARFNGEPINEAFYAELREHDRRTRKETARAGKIWGVRT
jgi:hypothetical protein